MNILAAIFHIVKGDEVIRLQNKIKKRHNIIQKKVIINNALYSKSFESLQ